MQRLFNVWCLSLSQSDHLFAEFLGDHEEAQSSVLIWVRTALYFKYQCVYLTSNSHSRQHLKQLCELCVNHM